jgi:GntR family transcriptional regulator/MocR family aminotransferase
MAGKNKLQIAGGAWLRQGDSMHGELYGRIRKGIITGEMPAGFRLPSTRVLSDQLGIARSTVSLAYEHLLSEGYVESRHGSGHYVADFVTDAFERLAVTKRPSDALQVSAGHIEDDFSFVPHSFRSAIRPVPFRANYPALDRARMQAWITLYSRGIRQAARSAIHPGYFGEADAAGDPLLRRAIAEHISLSRGVRCSAEQVIVTAGSQHAMDLLMRVIGQPGRKAWIEDPCFPGALAVLRGAHLIPVPVPVDAEGIDVAHGTRTAPNACLAIVCPSKQYPLGYAMSLQRRLALIAWARQNKSWIIEDDYDSEYRFLGKPIPSLQGLDGGVHVIYIGTFSKVLFPGLRIGFIVAPPALVDPLIAVRSLAGRHGNPLDQQVLARFIVEGHLGRHIRKMRKLYRIRMESLLYAGRRWLSGAVELDPAEAGLQTLGRLSPEFNDQVVSQAAAQQGIEVADLSRYRIAVKLPPSLVFGFGGFDEREIDTGARALAKVLEALRGEAPGKGRTHPGNRS